MTRRFFAISWTYGRGATTAGRAGKIVRAAEYRWLPSAKERAAWIAAGPRSGRQNDYREAIPASDRQLRTRLRHDESTVREAGEHAEQVEQAERAERAEWAERAEQNAQDDAKTIPAGWREIESGAEQPSS